jgi:type II secretory pathway component PulC
MTLEVFVYTDVEGDRMAVINGRRYVKGQLVDGLYLVESINPDGVVLTYQGDRAVLRP